MTVAKWSAPGCLLLDVNACEFTCSVVPNMPVVSYIRILIREFSFVCGADNISRVLHQRCSYSCKCSRQMAVTYFITNQSRGTWGSVGSA